VLLAVEIARPIVFGVASGAAIGLVAIGLVLIYKSSRVFNFAAGEFVTLGAFGLYLGDRVWDLPYPVAMVIGVLAGLITALLVERLVVRPLSERPRVTILVATAAVATILIPIELMVGGVKPFPAAPAISGLGVQILGVYFSPQRALIVAALALSGLGLAYFFGRTDLGLATLASSQEPTASRLVGIKLNRISMLTWGAAGLLGGLAGVLLTPLTSTFAAGYGTTSVLISAFTAAVLGGMTSIPGAFVGGIVVGLVQSFAQFDLNDVAGSPDLAILIVLVGVLLVRPTGLLGKEA
jgi:branched-chain amino acid transport system permease protein